MKKNHSKLAKKQQQDNWNNAKNNHNVNKYMHYANLAIDQSNEIHRPTFWCYFDPHGNTTRMSNVPQTMKKGKKATPVIIVPVKASLSKINRKVEHRFRLLVGHTKTTETISEDTRGDIRRKREGIHVSKTTRSRRRRSRTLGEGKK